jgi:hypothetical protein
LDGATLASASAATSAWRQTALPTVRPLALTRGFSDDAAKQRQCEAFLNKNRTEAADLSDTVALLDDLLLPPTQVASAGSHAAAAWHPGPCSGSQRCMHRTGVKTPPRGLDRPRHHQLDGPGQILSPHSERSPKEESSRQGAGVCIENTRVRFG